MKTIKVTFANGNSLITSINGTDTEINAYYFGNLFNLGDGAGGDNMQPCTKVEFI